MTNLIITDSDFTIKDGYLTFTAYDDNNTAFDVEISRDEVLNMARFLNDNYDLVISDRQLKDNAEETQYFAQEVLEGWQRSTNKDEWSVIVYPSSVPKINFYIGDKLEFTCRAMLFISETMLENYKKKFGFTKHELINN